MAVREEMPAWDQHPAPLVLPPRGWSGWESRRLFVALRARTLAPHSKGSQNPKEISPH